MAAPTIPFHWPRAKPTRPATRRRSSTSSMMITGCWHQPPLPAWRPNWTRRGESRPEFSRAQRLQVPCEQLLLLLGGLHLLLVDGEAVLGGADGGEEGHQVAPLQL